MKARIQRLLAALAVLGALGWYLWELLDGPPPGLLLKLGLPTANRTTGESRTNPLGMELLEIDSGYFRMGSHELCDPGDLLGRLSAPLGLDWGEAPIHRGSECPVLWVRIAEPFWIARTEVTNAQFAAFAPDRAVSGAGDEPVTMVSQERALAFCAWLSTQDEGMYRLPTEAEWEYSCRAGGFGDWSTGDDPAELADLAWYHGNSGGSTHPVGVTKPNSWGLNDMHGNVMEWCAGKFDEWGIAGPIRGGAFNHAAELLRSAYRAPGPVKGSPEIGFRVVWAPE